MQRNQSGFKRIPFKKDKDMQKANDTIKQGVKTVYPTNPIKNHLDWITYIKIQNIAIKQKKRLTISNQY